MNILESKVFIERITDCCGSTKWVQQMDKERPFASIAQVHVLADQIWAEMEREDYLEAFAAHPKIGDKEIPVQAKNTESLALQEQSGMDSTDEQLKQEMQKANHEYLGKFGYIFIVFASGKSGEEMLSILKERLENDPEEELKFAAMEQIKITHSRLLKLLDGD